MSYPLQLCQADLLVSHRTNVPDRAFLDLLEILSGFLNCLEVLSLDGGSADTSKLESQESSLAILAGEAGTYSGATLRGPIAPCL